VLNLLALSLAIWLGFYIITYSPRRLISWLTGLALWSISGIFLNMLLAITPPPAPENLQNWQIVLFPFWSPEVFQDGVGGWLAGWLATPAIAIWHHITVLLREEKPNTRFKIQILVMYMIAGITVYSQLTSTLMFSEASGDPLELNYLKPGVFYIVFMSLLIVISAISAYNLVVAAKSTLSNLLRKQLNTLFIATCFAGMTGPISLLALFEEITVPRVINTVLLGATIIMIGISITRYSALIEGRLIRRDFIYNASVISVILLIYMGITWLAIQLFNFPSFAYIYVAVLAIISHSLVDIARRYLGRIFLKFDDVLRSELHKLSRQHGEEIESTVEGMFRLVCAAVRATYGIIFTFKGEQPQPIASFNWAEGSFNLPKANILADDLLQLHPNQFSPPFTDASLLVPLYNEAEQIGAIILGHPVNSVKFPQEDLELILESGDLIAETIAKIQESGKEMAKTTEMIRSIHGKQEPAKDQITTKSIEDLLRNVLDYAYLGSSNFSNLQIVCAQLPQEAVTHIDRGKQVYQILEQVVEKLRPQDAPPRDPPPREWHPYLILYRAYFQDKLNREIMAELYISEGTFNRTRRAALRSVARALQEMQQAHR
jgi:hypothetical protein